MSTSTAMVAVPPPRTRSRVSNGMTLFVEADGRSAWARRFSDLIDIYVEHIGGNPTAPQRALIRRIAALDVEAERLEGDMAEGRPIDLDLFNRLAGSQRRLLQQLGFHATRRDKSPSLADIIARHAT